VRGGDFGGITTPSGANNPRIAVNTVESCQGDQAVGIYTWGYTTFAVVARNTVTGCRDGIVVLAHGDGSGAQVRRNVATGNSLGGISVGGDPAAFVWRNTANGNGIYGIGLGGPGATVKENTANDNGVYGFDAEAGTIDGGGNTATGNGTENCRNVSCGP
jgi:hypothetical protein